MRRSTLSLVPELPEIQAHAERLTEAFGGAALARVEPLSFTALKTAVPPADAAVGQALRGVGRRGKHLLLDFGPTVHVVHLMQGGRLRPDEKLARRPRGGQLRWRFDDGRALLLTEPGTERKAGVWVLPDEPDPRTEPPLDELGPEADEVDAALLAERFTANSMRLHGFLRDQHALAGLGRRLANELCWRARLSPFASTGKLGAQGAATVVAALAEQLAEDLAVERGRSDMSSAKDRPGAVHGRVGEACPRDGDEIRAVEYNAYTVAYCPTCQTGGQVLADNTTSKFLK